MLKTVDELKSLILWAKEQHLTKLKVGDVEVEISVLGFPNVQEFVDGPVKELTSGSATLSDTDTEQAQDDEDLLFWSAKA